MPGASRTSTSQLNQSMGSAPEGSQYLTFTLGEGSYGLDILRVREIKGYADVTRIPNTPTCIKGVLNLRGTVIPIIDLRVKFGMAHREYNHTTVIIMVEFSEQVRGIIVDTVSDVMNLSEEDIQSVPELGDLAEHRFISGIGKLGDELVSLLDVDQILSSDDIELG